MAPVKANGCRRVSSYEGKNRHKTNCKRKHGGEIEAAFCTGSWVRLQATNREKRCGTKTNQRENRLGMTNGRCNKKKKREGGECEVSCSEPKSHLLVYWKKIKKKNKKNKHRNFSFPDLSSSFFFSPNRNDSRENTVLLLMG